MAWTSDGARSELTANCDENMDVSNWCGSAVSRTSAFGKQTAPLSRLSRTFNTYAVPATVLLLV